MKLTFTLTKLCLISWVTVFLAHIAIELMVLLHHRSALDRQSASISVSGLILCFVLLRRQNRGEERNRLTTELWRATCLGVGSHSRGLALFRNFCLLVQSVALCLLTALALHLGSRVGETVLSYGAYFAGQYELGERIFILGKANRYDLRNVSLAGLWNWRSDTGSSTGDEAKFTEVISNVYGPDSREMAYRQEELGSVAFRRVIKLLGRDIDNPAGKTNSVAVVNYFRKALSIYSRKNALVDQVRVLELISECQAILETYDDSPANLPESAKTLELAINLSANCPNEEDLADTLDDLASNVDKEAKTKAPALRLRAERIRLAERQVCVTATVKLACLFLVLMGAAYGVSASNKALANRLRSKSLLALSISCCQSQSLEALSNLVLVELWNRNLEQADLYSQQLLVATETL